MLNHILYSKKPTVFPIMTFKKIVLMVGCKICGLFVPNDIVLYKKSQKSTIILKTGPLHN